MSRSAELAARATVRATVRASLTATLVVGAGLGAVPASAEDARPVREIVAPALDIDTGTADLAGAATVQQHPGRVKVRLSSTVLFGKDSAVLRPGARDRLREVAAELADTGEGTLRITGYTDDLGSAQHGLVLSRERAQAVADVLRPLLPHAIGFVVTGRGEADPVVPNRNEHNRELNRRVELLLASH